MPDYNLPDGTALVHFLWTVTGDPEPMSFAIGVRTTTGADAQGVCDGAYIAMSGGYGAPNWYDQWTFQGTRLEVQAGAIAETLIPLAGDGGAAGTLPQNCSLIVKKITGVAGRAFRGRCYVPPISLAEVDVNNVGMIDNTVVATIQGNWDGFIAALEGVDDVTALVLAHQSAEDPTDITNWVVEGQIATQRRRLR